MKPGKVAITVAAATFLFAASFATAQHEQVVSSPNNAKPMGMMSGKMGGGMGMMGVPPEKQEAVKLIQDEYKAKLFALHQDVRAKYAELNAIMLQTQPDTTKAKAVSKDLTNLKAQEMDLNIDMHARISKETGVRLPMMPMMPMGMGE